MKSKPNLILFALGMVLGAIAMSAAPPAPSYTRIEDVVYGRKFGTALTLDVFKPAEPNGCAVLFIISGGGWMSGYSTSARNYERFLERGYTVFAIVHGAPPKFNVIEITADIHRAVRFVRHNAARYGVDPDKFGITGSSSAGHLALMIGLRGGPGPADAQDPVDRESSAVQAVACFYPYTDFLNWSRAGDDQLGVGETGVRFKDAWDARIETRAGREALDQEVSPIHFISAHMAPTLIVHGEADQKVPIYQAQSFEKKCRELGATCQLIVRAGEDRKIPADWFDQQLRGRAPQAAP